MLFLLILHLGWDDDFRAQRFPSKCLKIGDNFNGIRATLDEIFGQRKETRICLSSCC